MDFGSSHLKFPRKRIWEGWLAKGKRGGAGHGDRGYAPAQAAKALLVFSSSQQFPVESVQDVAACQRFLPIASVSCRGAGFWFATAPNEKDTTSTRMVCLPGPQQ